MRPPLSRQYDFNKEDDVKKTYEKPVLVRRDSLAAVVAVSSPLPTPG